MKKQYIIILLISMLILCSCKSDSQNVNILNNVDKFSFDNSFVKIVSKESKDDFLYKTALFYIDQKKYPMALHILNDLSEYFQAKELADQIRYVINAQFLVSGVYTDFNELEGAYYTYGYIGVIDAKNNVIQINQHKDALSADDWNGVKKLSALGDYLDGLSIYGTVLSTCPYSSQDLKQKYEADLKNDKHPLGLLITDEERYRTSIEILEFNQIIDFLSSYPDGCTVLLNNGEIKTASYHPEKGFKTIDDKKFIDWKNQDIVQLWNTVYALRRDGTIATTTWKEPQWTEIAMFECADAIYALKANGTIETNSSLYKMIDQIGYTEDIISISCSGSLVAVLRRDGIVNVFSGIEGNNIKTDDWKDIVAIEVKEEAGIGSFIVGLKSDGTLVIAGSQDNRPDFILPDVSGVKGLYVPEIEIKTRSIVGK